MANTHIIDELFAEIRQALASNTIENPYERFGLLENPFPAAGQYVPGICVDQEEIKHEFSRSLQETLRSERSLTFTITGQTGAGKTNVLKYLHEGIEGLRIPITGEDSATRILSIYVDEAQGGYFEVHRRIVDQLHSLFFSDFYSMVQQNKISLQDLQTKSSLSPVLLAALNNVLSSNWGQIALFAPSIQNLNTLRTWLRGDRLSAQEKKVLRDVSVDVGKSSTLAVKLISDLVKLFRNVRLFSVLVILIDEFEEVFSGASQASQLQFLKDLRNLFDSLSEGVVIITATTPISDKLEQLSPALSRRMGENYALQPVGTSALALDYARRYLGVGRERFEQKMERTFELPGNIQAEDSSLYPLTRAEVVETFDGIQQKFSTVLPGDLLAQLNLRLTRIVGSVQ